MRVIEQADIISLLQQTPDTPENAALISQLQALANASAVYKENFTYTTGAVTVTNGVTVGPTNIQIDASAPFVITDQMFFASLAAAAAQTVTTFQWPNVTVMLTDAGSGKNLMNLPVPIPSIFGWGADPYKLPMPRVLAANSILSITLTSREAASVLTIDLAFAGFKIFKRG